MIKKVKYIFLLILLILCFLAVNIKTYISTLKTDLSNSFFRLHIIANSNSIDDQNLKLKIRDNIIDYMNDLKYSNLTKSEVVEKSKLHLNEFKNIAQKTVIDSGYNYDVDVEIGNFFFPTKFYGNISLPSGNYDALKITIGNANGENWWCCLFPPLCFVDISSGIIDDESKEKLEQSLSAEEFAIITDTSKNIKLKFKILELFEN